MNTEQQPESLTTLWSAHINSWQKTALSQSAYCRDQKLHYHRFTYWRRKLSGQSSKKKSVNHSAFVPVHSSTPLTHHDLCLRLPDGTILHGITASNLLVVKQILALLP